MRTLEKRSIGGYVFSLETDACSKISEYIDELNEYYLKQESGKEVMDGIEERLAELLLEKCGQNGVVTDADVQGVIEILGRPEAIEKEAAEDDSGQPSNTRSSYSESERGPRKRLYRDMENARIGGVCSGLGAFFNLDPIIFRLAFILLTLAFFGIFNDHFIFDDVDWLAWFFPFLYVVLWIFLPPARTVRQKDQMRGNDGTVDGISQRIKTEKANSGDNSIATNVWPKVARIILVCLGVIFMIAGICGISAIGTVLVRHNYLYFKISEYLDFNPDIVRMFGDSVSVWLLALVCVVPFLLLLYWGVLMCFGLKSPKWKPDLILFILWLACLTILAVYTAITLADFV
jgi:phage shock protein PspC (stress-responsive transcriptional regulator)